MVISKLLATVLSTAIVIGTATFGAHAQTNTTAHGTQVFKAARGVMLEVGSKKIAGYYLAGDHVCDLTLMLANRADADGNVSGATTRMNIPVAAGTKTRVYTTDGNALEASCSLKANVMTLRPLDQTALAVK